MIVILKIEVKIVTKDLLNANTLHFFAIKMKTHSIKFCNLDTALMN
jgi:hypothetical protein